MNTSTCWSLAVVLSLASMVSPFLGDLKAEETDRDRARQLVNDGNALFKKGLFEEALDRFEVAYEVYPSEKILVNIAETHREMGRLDLAARAYRKFLDEASEADDSETFQRIGQRLKSLEPNVASLEVVCEEVGGNVSIASEVMGEIQTSPWILMPGQYDVSIEKEGFLMYTTSVALRAGETTRLDVTLIPARLESAVLARNTPQPESTVAASTLPPTETTRDDDGVLGAWWFWAGVAAVVAGGIVLGVSASSGGDSFVPGGELGRSSTADAEWTRL